VREDRVATFLVLCSENPVILAAMQTRRDFFDGVGAPRCFRGENLNPQQVLECRSPQAAQLEDETRRAVLFFGGAQRLPSNGRNYRDLRCWHIFRRKMIFRNGFVGAVLK